MDWFSAFKKQIPVKARGPIQDPQIFDVGRTTISAYENDYIIKNKRSVFAVKPNIFNKRYEKIPNNHEEIDGWFEVIKKQKKVRAKGPINKTELLSSIEGEERVPKGYYIVEGKDGEKFGVSPSQFQRTYEKHEK